MINDYYYLRLLPTTYYHYLLPTTYIYYILIILTTTLLTTNYQMTELVQRLTVTVTVTDSG